jgi:phage/plasmid-associated DNA primase
VPSPASNADATEVYGAYRDWSKAEGLVPMSQKSFGLISAEIGVAKKRSKRSRRVTYQGFAIRRAADRR